MNRREFLRCSGGVVFILMLDKPKMLLRSLWWLPFAGPSTPRRSFRTAGQRVHAENEATTRNRYPPVGDERLGRQLIRQTSHNDGDTRVPPWRRADSRRGSTFC